MNSKPDFEVDIAKACQATDEKLMRLLKQANGEKRPATHSRPGNGSEQRSRDAEANRRRKSRSRPKRASPAKSVCWGPPTAPLNTRIPAKMGDLLDDLVYRLRKERRGTGESATKQALACEAIEDLLRKYRMVV